MRGSRKHILDWTGQPEFVDEIMKLALPVSCRRTSDTMWMPKGHKKPAEARLERFGKELTSSLPNIWDDLANWWLVHRAGANTPNWDVALSCEIEGRNGLLLVEAKANEPELGNSGKPLAGDATANSGENHAKIAKAIAEANKALAAKYPEVRLRIDSHYQLANRLAFAWKLASMGVPTVLIYLGFTGDTGIADAGVPFRDQAHWGSHFRSHLEHVAPTSISETRVDCGPASFWLLVRSRPVIEVSPARPPRARSTSA